MFFIYSVNFKKSHAFPIFSEIFKFRYLSNSERMRLSHMYVNGYFLSLFFFNRKTDLWLTKRFNGNNKVKYFSLKF